MDCLSLFLVLIVLASLALAILGSHWGQPVMSYVFGFLAITGGISVLWFFVLPSIRKRWGDRGERVFRRVITAIGLAVVAVPLVVVFVAAARAIGPDPRFVVISVFFGVVVGGTALFIWWSKFVLRRSWRRAADRMGLTFDKSGPRLSGDYQGRPAQLYLQSVFRGVSREGVARYTHYTHLTLRLRTSAIPRLTVRKRDWFDRLFRRSRLRPFGDEILDKELVCKGDVDSPRAILQTSPALYQHLRSLLEFPLLELRVATNTITYVCRNALKDAERIVGVFKVTALIADVLERKRGSGAFKIEGNVATIAEYLRRIQEEGDGSNFVIFTVDSRKGYYIQCAAGYGQTLLWAEAVGSDFVEPEYALSSERLARLESMGWNAPEESLKIANFHREWEAVGDEDRSRVAREIVRAMVEVYGWVPDQPIEVELVLQD